MTNKKLDALKIKRISSLLLAELEKHINNRPWQQPDSLQNYLDLMGNMCLNKYLENNQY